MNGIIANGVHFYCYIKIRDVKPIEAGKDLYLRHFLVSLISIHQLFLIFPDFLILLNQNAARAAERLETITMR
jgi:hypothetical protein